MTPDQALAEHVPTASFGSFNMNGGGHSRYCSCGARFDVLYSELADHETDTKPLLDGKLAAHQAAVLAPLFAEAQAEAWDEGYSTGNAHNGRRDANPYRLAAAIADPEGRALVARIHERKGLG